MKQVSSTIHWEAYFAVVYVCYLVGLLIVIVSAPSELSKQQKSLVSAIDALESLYAKADVFCCPRLFCLLLM